MQEISCMFPVCKKTRTQRTQQIAVHGIPWISGKRQPPSGICMCINIYIHTYVAKEASHIILKKKQTMFHPGLLHQLLTVCHLAAGRYL